MGDWLLLTPTWKRESRLCGSVLPQPFISTRGRVWLFFHSQANSSGQAQGFRLSYIRGKLENICILLIHSINIPECVKILEIPLQFNPLATPRATCSILYLNISICSGTSHASMRICGKHEVSKVAAESLCRAEHASVTAVITT